jgi:ubiquinone/menaquinone biosynthesis C-methylase UbiE
MSISQGGWNIKTLKMKKEEYNYEQEVREYFAKKAEKYDDVDKQAYWILSDKLLWELLSKELNKFNGTFSFLEAGGGTGRWAKRILENYPNARGVTLDISREMLNEAKKKNSFGDRWNIKEGDIQKMNLSSENFDLVLNTHNVLGFVKDAKEAMREMTRVLKIGGKLISVIPNKDHAIFFNIYLKNLSFAKDIQEKNQGKFVENMPEIDLFTEESIKELYEQNNIKFDKCRGFPVYIYPGYNETQLEGQTKEIGNVLKDHFEEVFLIETNALERDNLAARGNNLFIVGIKK